MTGSEHESDGRGGRRRTPERGEQPTDPLEEPVASRATLARRLRAVERALADGEGVEFEDGADTLDPERTDERLGSIDERLDVVEESTEALCRAVRVLGEFLVARDRARRTDGGIESIQRAIEALPDAADGKADVDDDREDRIAARDADPGTAGTTGGGAVLGTPDPGTVHDGRGTANDGESATEWLDRVTSGGVTPPPVE